MRGTVPSITLSRHVLVLALDTTTRSGSAAVVSGGELLCEIVGDGSRTHGERLPRDLMRVLEAASVGLDSIDLLAVAAGTWVIHGIAGWHRRHAGAGDVDGPQDCSDLRP